MGKDGWGVERCEGGCRGRMCEYQMGGCGGGVGEGGRFLKQGLDSTRREGGGVPHGEGGRGWKAWGM